MNALTTIGLDVAKHTFQVVGCDRQGQVVTQKVLRRGQVTPYFANLPACVVGLEACASAHFWARELHKLGHEVRLLPPQHVKAYVRGNKTDYHDARAIAEAVRRPGLRVVAVKTPAQQDVQALYRLRAARMLEAHASRQEAVQRVQTVPGFGPVVASVFHAFVGTGREFRRGRDGSAALGLGPKQHSSGGKTVLLGSSKRGDRYLRSLLVRGARAVLRRAAHRDDRLSQWITRLQATRGTNKATVALANKLARIGWAVVRGETPYRAA